MSELAAAHQQGRTNTGVSPFGEVIDAEEEAIFDNLDVKFRAIKLATNAAVTILRISQLIMAKTSNGPKLPGGSGTMGSYDNAPFM